MRVKSMIFLAMLLSIEVVAQSDTIRLINRSFEGKRQAGIQPPGWVSCGFPGETPPDTQPDFFEVTEKPVDGDSYLGMVVRSNDTWESVGQALTIPLEAGKCYEVSVFLARAKLYVSGTRKSSGVLENHITPAKFKIYGGFDYCDKREVLAETREITQHRWLKYTFKLEPTDNYTHINLEAFYQTPVLFPYNGNLLIDNASDIVVVPCEEMIADIQGDTTPEEVVKEVVIPEPDTTPIAEEVVTVDTTPATPVEIDMKDIAAEDLEAGQIFQIEDIYFDTNSYNIADASSDALNDLYLFLKRNQSVVIEIGGHTNGRAHQLYAKKLSTERAQAVVNYLKSRGIANERLHYKGYGKSRPIDTNATAEGRKRNQRVEVKILKS